MARKSAPPPLSPAALLGLSLTAVVALGLVGGLVFTTFAANSHPPLAYYLATGLIAALITLMHVMLYRWRHDGGVVIYIYCLLVFEIAVLTFLISAP